MFIRVGPGTVHTRPLETHQRLGWGFLIVVEDVAVRQRLPQQPLRNPTSAPNHPRACLGKAPIAHLVHGLRTQLKPATHLSTTPSYQAKLKKKSRLLPPTKKRTPKIAHDETPETLASQQRRKASTCARTLDPWNSVGKDQLRTNK